MKLFCSWQALKEIKEKKQLEIYYYDNSCHYEILIIEDMTTWYTELWQDCSKCAGLNEEENDINLADFVENYKTSAQKL